MKKAFVFSICLLLIFSMSISILAKEVKEIKEVKDELIIINKKNNKLAYYVNGEKIKEFDVATGKTPTLTPEGTFKIINKIKNRPYYKEKIPGADPRNPLGDRWIGLEVNGTMGTTYAIHGNSNEKSIGKYVSAGCIRMHNKEVQWLFDQVGLYTPVIITSSHLSFAEIAEKNHYTLGYQTLSGELTFNGLPLELDVKPVLYLGKTMVPLRDIFEAIGAAIEWDQKTQTITVRKGKTHIIHQVYTNQAIINEELILLETESRIIRGTTMIPLRFVTDAFGAQTVWDGSSQSIQIFLPMKRMYDILMLHPILKSTIFHLMQVGLNLRNGI